MKLLGGNELNTSGFQIYRPRPAKKFLQTVQERAVCGTMGYPLLGRVFAHTHFSRESVTPPPHTKAVLQVLALDLYQPTANSFSFAGNNPSPCIAPDRPLNRGSMRICLQCCSLLFLHTLWGAKLCEMTDLPLHTTASLERKTACYFSRAKGSVLNYETESRVPIKRNEVIKFSCTLCLTRFFLFQSFSWSSSWASDQGWLLWDSLPQCPSDSIVLLP